MNKLLCAIFLLLSNSVLAQNFDNLNPSKVSSSDWTKVQLSSADKQGIRIRYNNNPMDLTAYDNAGMWVYNSSKKPLDVTLIVKGTVNYKKHTCRYTIAPKDSVLTQVILMRSKKLVSEDWKKHLGAVFMYPYNMHPHWTAFDNSTIKEFSLLINSKDNRQFSIKAPQGIGEYTFDQHQNYDLPLPLVDKMGQLNSEEWEGKLTSTTQLEEQGKADQKQFIGADFTNPEYNKFGGWKNGPTFEKTGHFYTKKYKGKWYFVDPEGKLFISMGITGVGQGSGSPTNNRAFLFTEDKEIEALYTDKNNFINHYERNLVRKYGKDWKAIHKKISLGRLKQWNINTYGAWSSIEREQKIPYTIIVHPPTTNFGKMTKVPDPYADNFEQSVRSRINMAAKKYNGDEWNLGIFVNNEIHWGTTPEELSFAIFNESKNVPARKAFVSFLKKKYDTIKGLNKAWNKEFTSFDNAKLNNVKKLNSTVKEDLTEFTQQLADRYYATCAEAVHDIMPGHLYLGSRIHGNVKNKNATIQNAAAKHCDVVSYNIYEYDVLSFKPLYKEDKPILIGEFHFGVNEHGVWGDGLKYAISGEHQGQLYETYMREVVAHPNLVGAHWFQWSDQPVTGRKDGENYRIGVVDITDQIHQPLTEAMKKTSKSLYNKKKGKSI